MPDEDCFWCNMGDCTQQIGGTGQSFCWNASAGSEYCGMAGDYCTIVPGEN